MTPDQPLSDEAGLPENTPPISIGEFVPLVAALMSLASLGIDSMLPALPDIGHRLHVTDPADWPLVVTVFVIGLGLGQLIHGPLTDRYGRRPIIIVALTCNIVASLLAGLAGSFTLLLAARFAAGLSVAASRVVVIALIRDCFSGRAMAKVSSIAFMVFMAMPVLAPSFGALVLLIGTWRLIFEIIAIIGAIILLWFSWRMPETLSVERRAPLSIARLAAGCRKALTDRASLGYTLAAAAMQGAIFGYLSSIQPIMEQIYRHPTWLAPVFAASAGTMALANLLNARIVMHLGMRRISRDALVAMILASSVGAVAASLGAESLAVFVVFQAISMAAFGLAMSNMSAMAMENMGDIAGVASSVQGFIGITAGAVIGAIIGRAFDGSTVPLHLGFVAAAGVSLGIAAVVERGRLFKPS